MKVVKLIIFGPINVTYIASNAHLIGIDPLYITEVHRCCEVQFIDMYIATDYRTPLMRAPRVLSRSYSDLSTHDVGVNTDISGDIMDDQEYNIEGALADEVQLLQNAQETLYHQIEEKENEIRKLKLEQLSSNLELKTLNEVRSVCLYD